MEALISFEFSIGKKDLQINFQDIFENIILNFLKNSGFEIIDLVPLESGFVFYFDVKTKKYFSQLEEIKKEIEILINDFKEKTSNLSEDSEEYKNIKTKFDENFKNIIYKAYDIIKQKVEELINIFQKIYPNFVVVYSIDDLEVL